VWRLLPKGEKVAGHHEVSDELFDLLALGSADVVLHACSFQPGLSQRLRGTIGERPTCAEVEAAMAEGGAASSSSGLQLPGPVAVDDDDGELCVQGRRFKFPVAESLQFLDASRHLRQLRRADQSAEAIMRASFPKLFQELAAEMQRFPSHSFLRKQRILLDCACMLLQRHEWQSYRARGDSIDAHWFFDGSPSSGYEALVGVEQCVINGVVCKPRNFPIVYLGYGHQALRDKVFGMLHVLLLEVGPSVEALRYRLSKVTGMITDWGVESQLADVGDSLGEFLAASGCREAAAQCDKLEFLFPHCVWMPGWHHSWDTTLRQVLSAAQWWASWLQHTRNVTKFFRIQVYRSGLTGHCESIGLDGAAVAALGTCPPSFAQWRWSTLHGVCRWILRGEECLRAWSLDLFSRVKDGVAVRGVHQALADSSWWSQLRLVADVVSLVQECRMWGSGCPCHEMERLEAVRQDVEYAPPCFMGGRRLPEAWPRLERLMSECRRKSEAVEPGDACYGAAMSAELLQDRRHLLLMLQSVVDKRFGFLNRLPWSLARWHDRAHVERCRAEYTATMDSAKHRVARAVFQGLASDIDVYVAGGTPSLALEAAFVSVSLLPLSEQVVESPHAEMKRESLRAAASSRSWHSSTNRLVQNLEYVRALPAAGDGVVTMAHLAMEWRRVTRVLQLSTKHCLRRRRLPWASFPSLVYRAAHRESGTVEKLRSPLTHTHTHTRDT